ncbi:DUF72 domain-containing protein [Flavobacterium sp. MK4S-17]|uniref:DUF72 domain-containing protein n=1 Tax=Flavobacterium sp. MK4S-17 TaxID=2543737 RepID=UPI001357B95C|nr:DUF72 domain-containing protein [Flavobacterium sp. MK4S-17]
MGKTVYIGTSGWQYKHWRGTFYPDDIKVKDHFLYYQEHFNTVEINNSFYRLPAKETFEKWYNNSPEGFVYVIKANRYITHLKKLNDPDESLEKFLDNIALLKDKLGPVLYQLPPGLEIDIPRLENFLKHLPKDVRHVFEFRNQSWYNEDVYKLLSQYNCAFCIYELAGHISPLSVTADFVYVRLHGPGAKYQGSYTDSTLKKWTEQCKSWIKDNKDVYVYFDNDEKGYAAFNALTLKKLMKKAL